MKKLEDFNCKKVKLDSIWGGSIASNTFSQNTATAGPEGTQADDGSDEEWDT